MPTVWFIIIAVLWVGYFVLEGFDFGVGTLLPILGRDDRERRVLINTIGPVWDGNEVWVLTAGGATFAAFPEWYASLFSGFYLALLLILVALILRGVAFEYRGKRDDLAWRKRWDAALFLGSLLPAFLWGVAFANIVQGTPIDEAGNYTGTLFTLLNPYGILGGLATLLLFFTHGVQFVALKTDGELRERARALAGRSGIVTIVVAAAFLVWTVVAHLGVDHAPPIAAFAAAAAVALIGATVANRVGREGVAFTLSAVTTLFVVATILAAQTGLPVDVVALAARRYAYGVRTVTPEVLAAQQKIADTFHSLKLIPKPIVVRDAQPPANLLAKE